MSSRATAVTINHVLANFASYQGQAIYIAEVKTRQDAHLLLSYPNINICTRCNRCLIDAKTVQCIVGKPGCRLHTNQPKRSGGGGAEEGFLRRRVAVLDGAVDVLQREDGTFERCYVIVFIHCMQSK